MPLDPSQVKWDPIDASQVQWDQPDGLSQLAQSTGPGDAFTIAAGRMGHRMYEGMKQAGMGVGAILSELLPQRLRDAAQEELAKKLTAQQQGMAGDTDIYKSLEKAHPIATTLGEAAPLVAAPMLRVADGAGAGAAAMNAATSAALPSAIEYGTAGERGARAAGGAIGGAVGSGLTSGAVKVMGGVKNVLTPEAQRLAALAEDKFNIPLNQAQRTGNKALQTINAALEQMPVTSGQEAMRIGAQRDAFTREVMKTLGSDATEATEATLGAAKSRMSGEFERIFGKVHVQLDDPAIQTNIGKAVQDAIDTLGPDQAKIIAKRAGDILGKVDDNGTVAGKAYQAWRTSIQQQAEKTSDKWLATNLTNLRKAVDEAAYKSAAEAGEDGALQAVRGQWKNMRTISPLVAKSENGVISPSLLRGEVMRANPDFATKGAGDLGELAKIGRSFIADQVPNSGTAQRQLAQNLLTGGGVGGLAYMTSGDPATAAKWGVGSVLLPKAIQSGLNSKVGQKVLAEREVDPLVQALMDRVARLGSLGLARGASER
jgi:hypothetical protein